jgi:hypothetical protein
MTYLIAVVVDNDPRRTRDVAMQGRSEWQAAWLYQQLNPGAWVVAVRACGEG